MDKTELDSEKSVIDQKSSSNETVANEEKSKGVIQMEAVSSTLTPMSLFMLLFGIFLVSYAYSLDSKTRTVFQTYATNDFGKHSLLSTLNIVKSVGAAAIQPPLSKAANIFGRFEIVTFGVVLYIIGTVIEACSTNIQTFAGGQVLWVMGYRAFQLLFEIVIADVTTTRDRLLYTNIPRLSTLINTWVSGNITALIMDSSHWKWGVGIWAAIIPVVAIPIYLSLFLTARKAKRQGKLDNVQSIFTGKNVWENTVILFWHFDVIGLLLIAAILCLVLIPLTIAGGTSSRWGHADVISMLVIGFLCIPTFVLWEVKFAKYPCIPFSLLKNRAILTCFAIGILTNLIWMIPTEFLYTVLVVSFDESIASATRIISLYSFMSVISGLIAGLIVRYTRRIKWVTVSGTLLYMLGLGLMIKYRTTLDNGKVGVIAAQIVLGTAAGLIPYPVQAHIQIETKHEHVAIITAVYLTMRHVGSALGNTIAGVIWTNTLPQKLVENFNAAAINNATALAREAYKSPLTFIKPYPMGAPERMAIIGAYESTQKILTITGCCIAIPMVIAALTLSNPLLGDTQSLPNKENNEEEVKN
ncbi:unnamed protein product [Cunninghamella echinulata]